MEACLDFFCPSSNRFIDASASTFRQVLPLSRGRLAGGAHGILFPSLSAMAIDAHIQKFPWRCGLRFYRHDGAPGSPLALIFLV